MLHLLDDTQLRDHSRDLDAFVDTTPVEGNVDHVLRAIAVRRDLAAELSRRHKFQGANGGE